MPADAGDVRANMFIYEAKRAGDEHGHTVLLANGPETGAAALRRLWALICVAV